MASMLAMCRSLAAVDVSNFDTQNVETMANMFYKCNSLTSIDVSSFDTGKVTDMSGMFSTCGNLTTITASEVWSTEAVTNSDLMFYNDTKLIGGEGTAFDAEHVDAEYAHRRWQQQSGIYDRRTSHLRLCNTLQRQTHILLRPQTPNEGRHCFSVEQWDISGFLEKRSR